MQSNQPFSPLNPRLGTVNQTGGYMLNSHIPPSFSGTVLPSGILPMQSLRGVEFQPSEACPRNFIIFDQTDNRSQIMFHPAIGAKFCCAGPNDVTPLYGDNAVKGFADSEQREVASTLKEDSEDIDALLSFDEEEQDECDEEEVSTARTDMNYGSNSPDSCSNYKSPPRKIRLTSLKKISSGNGSDCSERKRLKMRKMVRALRGIVPGANQMNTVAVLDEAVRYLKSLKVEVQKLGVGKLKSCA